MTAFVELEVTLGQPSNETDSPPQSAPEIAGVPDRPLFAFSPDELFQMIRPQVRILGHLRFDQGSLPLAEAQSPNHYADLTHIYVPVWGVPESTVYLATHKVYVDVRGILPGEVPLLPEQEDERNDQNVADIQAQQEKIVNAALQAAMAEETADWLNSIGMQTEAARMRFVSIMHKMEMKMRWGDINLSQQALPPTSMIKFEDARRLEDELFELQRQKPDLTIDDLVKVVSSYGLLSTPKEDGHKFDSWDNGEIVKDIKTRGQRAVAIVNDAAYSAVQYATRVASSRPFRLGLIGVTAGAAVPACMAGREILPGAETAAGDTQLNAAIAVQLSRWEQINISGGTLKADRNSFQFALDSENQIATISPIKPDGQIDTTSVWAIAKGKFTQDINGEESTFEAPMLISKRDGVGSNSYLLGADQQVNTDNHREFYVYMIDNGKYVQAGMKLLLDIQDNGATLKLVNALTNEVTTFTVTPSTDNPTPSPTDTPASIIDWLIGTFSGAHNVLAAGIEPTATPSLPASPTFTPRPTVDSLATQQTQATATAISALETRMAMETSVAQKAITEAQFAQRDSWFQAAGVKLVTSPDVITGNGIGNINIYASDGMMDLMGVSKLNLGSTPDHFRSYVWARLALLMRLQYNDPFFVKDSKLSRLMGSDLYGDNLPAWAGYGDTIKSMLAAGGYFKIRATLDNGQEITTGIRQINFVLTTPKEWADLNAARTDLPTIQKWTLRDGVPEKYSGGIILVQGDTLTVVAFNNVQNKMVAEWQIADNSMRAKLLNSTLNTALKGLCTALLSPRSSNSPDDTMDNRRKYNFSALNNWHSEACNYFAPDGICELELNSTFIP